MVVMDVKGFIPPIIINSSPDIKLPLILLIRTQLPNRLPLSQHQNKQITMLTILHVNHVFGNQ